MLTRTHRPLWHQRDDWFALLSDQKYQHLHLLGVAGVPRLMNMLKRKIRMISSLEGHWRVRILLENQRAFQDVQEFRPRMKVSPQRTAGNEIRSIHNDRRKESSHF